MCFSFSRKNIARVHKVNGKIIKKFQKKRGFTEKIKKKRDFRFTEIFSKINRDLGNLLRIHSFDLI